MIKTLITFAAATASISAFAASASLNCREVRGTIDSGYQVSISADSKTASVSRQSIAGPRPVAQLECSAVEGQGNPTPDGQRTLLVCSEPNLRDAGYSLEIQQGGLAGLTTGVLAAESFAGARPVAKLICQ